MSLCTDHLARCIRTLEISLARLTAAEAGSIDYEIYRNAVVKGFELALDTAGNLLRKAVKTYVGNPRAVDELTYKDVFRHATRHALIEPALVCIPRQSQLHRARAFLPFSRGQYDCARSGRLCSARKPSKGEGAFLPPAPLGS